MLRTFFVLLYDCLDATFYNRNAIFLRLPVRNHLNTSGVHDISVAGSKQLLFGEFGVQNFPCAVAVSVPNDVNVAVIGNRDIGIGNAAAVINNEPMRECHAAVGGKRHAQFFAV